MKKIKKLNEIIALNIHGDKMSFQDEIQRVATEGTLGVVWLIGDDGKIYYTYGEWAVDPLVAFNAWKAQNPAVNLGGIKFTVIAISPERLISKNMGGQGYVIVAKCTNWPGAIVAWAPATVQMDYAYAAAARLAAKVQG